MLQRNASRCFTGLSSPPTSARGRCCTGLRRQHGDPGSKKAGLICQGKRNRLCVVWARKKEIWKPERYWFALYFRPWRSVAQSGSAPGLGPGGPRFESLYSDQKFIEKAHTTGLFFVCGPGYLGNYFKNCVEFTGPWWTKVQSSRCASIPGPAPASPENPDSAAVC